MIFVVYGRIYLNALLNALGMVGKNVWTLIIPGVLFLTWTLMYKLLGPVLQGGPSSFIAGFLVATVRSVLFSVYSYFLAQLVARKRVELSVDEIRSSLGAYFSNWISFFFILFLVRFGITIATKYNRDADFPILALSFIAYILLNAVPETVYLKGSASGVDTIQRAFHFFKENWIEWTIPNLVLSAVLAAIWLVGAVALSGTAGEVLLGFFEGALLHVFMVFRGFLYEALDGSTHRQRMYKYRGSL